MARYVANKGKYKDTYRAIRITPELYDRIRAEAEAEGLTLLETIQGIIDFYFEEVGPGA